MQGILYIDKPIGWTSFDVVNYIRRKVADIEGKKPKNVKVGHAGTLDPFATGLLIVLVGKNYTKQAATYSKQDKVYEVSVRLGKVSSTGDPEGELQLVSEAVPSEQELQKACRSLTGTILQVPPAFSAIKVNGKRAYKLAREGKTVILEPREVTVHRLDVRNYDYPSAQLVAGVSSGTYIRSLVESIGDLLKVGAYTSELRRTSIGEHTIAMATSVEAINEASLQNLLQPTN
jgi:tRNA pseudouridine55 synthase